MSDNIFDSLTPTPTPLAPSPFYIDPSANTNNQINPLITRMTDEIVETRFDYDREQFVLAKQSLLQAANISSVANAAIKEKSKMYSTDFSYNEYGDAFTGKPYDTYSTVDFVSLTDGQKYINDATEAASAFNEKMYSMISTISELFDPELAEIVAQNEKETLKDYLTLGSQGGILEATQLYKLIERYGTDGLKLSDDQQMVLDYIQAQAEYAKLNGWEKFWQGAGTLLFSFAEGVVQVGEYVVDGAVTVAGGIGGLAVYAFDSEAGEAVWAKTADIVDYKVAETAYNYTVDALGINSCIAYGDLHTVGYAAGTFTGEVLLASLPGGAAITACVQGLKTTGKSMNSTAGNESLSAGDRILNASGNGAVAAVTSYAIATNNAGLKADIKNPMVNVTSADIIRTTGVNTVCRTGKVVITNTNNYYVSGSQASYGDYMSGKLPDMTTEVFAGAMGDIGGINKAFAGAGQQLTTGQKAFNTGYNIYKKGNIMNNAIGAADKSFTPEYFDKNYDNVEVLY